MNKQKINVLGTTYTVLEISEDKEPRLKDRDGFCDKTSKEIVITTKTEDCELKDWEWYRRKILRHEIIHAFFMESGLQENFENKPFGVMETTVDWIAIQFPKIAKVYEQLGIM